VAAPTAPLLFVSVASYNDPELLPTLHDAYAKAAHPELLRFGVVDQCVEDRYKALPSWKEQIRYLWMQARDARGVCFARSIIQGMMDGEAYVLQIDSHMRFDPEWDRILIDQLRRIGDGRALLTASPMPWTPEAGNTPMPAGKVIKLEQHPDYPLRNRASLLPNPSGEPIPGQRLAAGCLFAAGHLYDEVPYDPHLYFNGEELVYAQRLMARGWTIYHPAVLPVYHLYKQADGDPSLVHWGKTVERYWDHQPLRSKGERRIAEAQANRLGPVYSLQPEERPST
jgi:hypothetical protein